MAEPASSSASASAPDAAQVCRHLARKQEHRHLRTFSINMHFDHMHTRHCSSRVSLIFLVVAENSRIVFGKTLPRPSVLMFVALIHALDTNNAVAVASAAAQARSLAHLHRCDAHHDRRAHRAGRCRHECRVSRAVRVSSSFRGSCLFPACLSVFFVFFSVCVCLVSTLYLLWNLSRLRRDFASRSI
jgi:hypothetical protein